MRGRLWGLALYLFVLGFILNLVGIVGHVLVSAFAHRWFGTPLPRAFTTAWFTYAWKEFDLARVLGVTIFVALSVVALALAVGFPAAYILARRNFRGKPVLLLLYFLPLLIPQMTYGIPLATTLYRYGIGGSVTGVILAVLVGLTGAVFFVTRDFAATNQAPFTLLAHASGSFGFSFSSAGPMYGCGAMRTFSSTSRPLRKRETVDVPPNSSTLGTVLPCRPTGPMTTDSVAGSYPKRMCLMPLNPPRIGALPWRFRC